MDGTAYTAPADVFDTLTGTVGAHLLTDKYGASLSFDARGMPNVATDTNGNTTTYTYNATYQLTGITDDRGKTYTITSNANCYLSSIADPGGRTWAFTYDGNDNLKTLKTPTTPDQPTGITITFNYDASNRLTSVVDGRGNTVWSFAWVASTGQISSLTIDGDAVSYAYATGITTRTDRNGNDHRYHHTGQQITRTDTMVGGVAKYIQLYRYSGVFLANTVLPRGNRIDYVFDTNGDLTERRHRTTDTATNDASDIVHAWGYNASNFQTSYTDPRGNAWTYGRDTAGNLTSVTNPTVTNPATQASSRSYTYNTLGQMTKATNEEGHVTDYVYFTTTGAERYLLKDVKADPTGLNLVTSYTYDSHGNVATITDPRGNATTQTWDNLRRLTKTEAPSPLGYEVKYEYDGNGNRTKMEVENVDKDGDLVTANPWFTTTYTYTNTDKLATLVEEIDVSTTRTTSFDHDANDNRIRVTKPEGNKEKWEFNERDWVVKHIRGEGDAKVSETEYAYDENGNRTTDTDGRDNDTAHEYDLFDRKIKTTNALSHYTETEYDKNGNATKVTRKNSSDAVLQRESSFFDERNRKWKTSALYEDPGTTYSDAVTTIERLKTNQIKKVTNPRSKITTNDYDNALRLTKTTDAMGNFVEYTLDKNGNREAWEITEKDGAANVTHEYEATFDKLNRRLTLVEIDRTNSSNKLTTEFHYDSRSNLVFEVNAEGNPTRWTFDGLSRKIKQERALSLGATINDFTTAQVTEWGYDDNSRMTSHKDDGPNESTWDYDALDRATKMTYPDTTNIQYEYDLNDNVTKTTDPLGTVIDDTFDALNRNTSRSVTRATGVLGTTSETRTFDGANRMLTNEDNDYKLEFEYAVIGFRSFVYSEEQSYVGGTAYAKTVTKTYDANGNKVTEAYPSGMSLDYTYNDIDQLTDISDGTNSIAAYTHIGTRKKVTTFQNGATTTRSYTGFRQEIASMHHETSSVTTISKFDYGYNKVHDRTYEKYAGTGLGDAFAYDKLRRLTTAWMGSSDVNNPATNSYVTKLAYNMDDDANRTSVVDTPYGQTATTTNYTTNNLNIYTNVGGTTQGNDANGNLTDNGMFLFEYDYKNLIVRVKKKSDGSTVAEYKYDALGRRVEKDVGSDVERHIRSTCADPGDRDNLSHVVSVYDGSNVWQQDFVWNDVVDGIVMLEQADVLDYDSDTNTTEKTRSFYHCNALGSVMETTDLNEAIVTSYRYAPYGAVTVSRLGATQTSDPLGQHWVFTGRAHDEETALMYYRARAYSPATGRFVQRDPISYEDGPGLFEYARSVPTVATDPSGQWVPVVIFIVRELVKHEVKRRVKKKIKRKIAKAVAKKVAKKLATGTTVVATNSPHSRRDETPDRRRLCVCYVWCEVTATVIDPLSGDKTNKPLRGPDGSLSESTHYLGPCGPGAGGDEDCEELCDAWAEVMASGAAIAANAAFQAKCEGTGVCER